MVTLCRLVCVDSEPIVLNLKVAVFLEMDSRFLRLNGVLESLNGKG
jgi:hypothetical protein